MGSLDFCHGEVADFLPAGAPRGGRGGRLVGEEERAHQLSTWTHSYSVWQRWSSPCCNTNCSSSSSSSAPCCTCTPSESSTSPCTPPEPWSWRSNRVGQLERQLQCALGGDA